MALQRLAFRFNPGPHEYIGLGDDAGIIYPHITGMLDRGGLVDDTWMTEESSARGRAVHTMTADYDLGALDPKTVVSAHRGYLLAHVAAMGMLRPEILDVEVPIVHPVHKFGGRLDRVVLMFGGTRGILEIKSGEKTKAHQVQTALQAILDATRTAIKAEDLGRWCLYLKRDGKFKVEDHNKDTLAKGLAFNEAYRLIKLCCDPVLMRAQRSTLAPGENPFSDEVVL